MILLVATRSEGKQREMRRLLVAPGLELRFPDDAGVALSDAEEGLETADSFEENARHKAAYFARRTGLPTLADDSGLEVLSLGGAPGVRSKRFAGATGTTAQVDAANNAELLRRLTGAPERRRRAQFRCVLAYYPTPDGLPRIFEGRSSGRILEAPDGDAGFGYDPLFWSDDLGMSFGRADAQQKDAVSHRGRACAAFLATLPPLTP